MFKRLGALFGGRAPLDTIADPVLQTDIMTMLVFADRFAADREAGGDDPCRDRTIRRVEVLELPTFSNDGGWVGPWTEAWTIDRCGEAFRYVVEFTASEDGGTNYRLRDPIGPDTDASST